MPSKPKEKINFELKNIPEGNYKIYIYKTGYKHNDAFTDYLNMGLP
ncbi:MAG: hypothetical protein H7068_06790 [Pedobacter sp.]|nr:hypothetical protein [Chitinophagaceae bacterium]